MRQRYLYAVLFVILLTLSLGYALLTTNLNIVGTTVVKDNKWDIYFDNVQVKSGSVTASTPVIDTAKTTVSYSVTLNLPGDYFEFTVDAVNDGTIDGMISTISNKLNGTEITTLPNYLEYSVSYSDGIAIQNNHLLEAGKTETYKVRVGYKKDISATDLPSTEQTLNLSFSVTYVQADDNAVKPDHPESFETDSWNTIVNAVKTGNTSVYNVGDTKTVDMGTLGTHTLRIANKSTPTECSTTGFSQTACGFVLEFADIITTHNMNSTSTNVGSWPASEMRTYVNTDIYNALPTELKNGIIDTIVVSGHGDTSGETNFTSTDKLYLLSTHEVWEDVDGNTSGGIDCYDTAYNNTRQLDYYAGLNVTTSSYSGAIKQLNGTNSYWWLRSASSYTISTGNFNDVNSYGWWDSASAYYADGVSPAFRIG
ncbi:MAG: hypothetical protein IJ842_03210 [Bacilli bacterium]|nr:hypothetical protein [Bacilli bacterium]